MPESQLRTPPSLRSPSAREAGIPAGKMGDPVARLAQGLDLGADALGRVPVQRLVAFVELDQEMVRQDIGREHGAKGFILRAFDVQLDQIGQDVAELDHQPIERLDLGLEIAVGTLQIDRGVGDVIGVGGSIEAEPVGLRPDADGMKVQLFEIGRSIS